LLYSKASHFAVIYHFGHESFGSNVVSLQDPARFQLPQLLAGQMSLVNGLALHSIDFTIEELSSTEPDYGLFKLIACTTDGKVMEAVYKRRLGGSALDKNGSPPIVRLFLPSTATDAVLSAKFVDDDDLDEFVVADDSGEEYSPGEGKELSRDQLSPNDNHLRWRNWQRLLDYDILQRKESSPSPLENMLYDGLNRFEGLQVRNDVPRAWLVSHLVDEPQLLDVEQDSASGRIWLDNLKLRNDISVESIGSGPGTLSTTAPDSLLHVYEQYYLLYVESLGPQLTDRNRVNRERVIRRLIGDAFLGNLILRPSNKADRGSPADPEFAPRSDTEVPSSAVETDARGIFSSPSSFQRPAAEEEPIAARLQDWCAFRDQTASLSLSHPLTISNILAHIPDTIEADPADYSYQSTNQRLRLAQEERAAQSLNPRERRKAVKEAARLQRKLEKTSKIGQEVTTQRRQLPSITSAGRGIVLPGREAQSSQGPAPDSSQGGIFGPNMTQPERGAFGTRPTKTKERDKGATRKAGF
jgi:hypothetical protein